jgi:hypothetical protein
MEWTAIAGRTSVGNRRSTCGLNNPPDPGELSVTPDESAEAIRRRMAELRREMTTGVRDVSRSAREMTNPLYYIRHFPWTSAAVAAAIGYLLVPKKKQVIKPDPEMLAELVRNQKIKVDTVKAGTDSQGLLQSLVVMGLTWALRTGLAYAGQQIAAAAARKTEEEAPPPAPSPLEEPWNTTR